MNMPKKSCPLPDQKKKKALLTRFNRIKGQIEGINRMIEENKTCTEIFNQIKSVKQSLNGASEDFLKLHLNQCFLSNDKDRDQILKLIFKP
jgi:DNA-binding FrmR family transcriptional regulator